MIPGIDSTTSYLYARLRRIFSLRKVGLTVVLVVAGCLRIFLLGSEAYWNDEAITLWYIQQYNPLELLYEIPLNQPHLPLYYLILDVWTAIVGLEETLVRVPSALFGTLTVAVVYLLTKRLYDTKVALFSALLIAVSPFHVRLSQYVRMYSLLGLTTVLSYYSLVSMREVSGARWRWAYLMSTGLMLTTHVYGLYVLLSQVPFLWRWFGDSGSESRITGISGKVWVPLAIAVISLVGLLGIKLLSIPLGLSGVPILSEISTFRQVGRLFDPVPPDQIFHSVLAGSEIKGGFFAYDVSAVWESSNGITDWIAGFAYPYTGYLVVGSVLGMYLYGRDRVSGADRISFVWMAVPLLAAVLTGLLGVQFRPRYAVVSAIPLLVLFVRSTSMSAGTFGRFVLAAVALVFLAQTGAMYDDTSAPGYGDANEYIEERGEVTDAAIIVYYRGAGRFATKPAGFYFRDSTLDIESVPSLEPNSASLGSVIGPSHDRIWLVTQENFKSATDIVVSELSDSGYRLRSTREFAGGVFVYEYVLADGDTPSIPRP